MSAPPRNVILAGDAVRRLRQLPSASIDTCITSPPYFRLRRYAAADGQLGQEPEIGDWVANLRAVVAEIARVLKPHGSLWLNLGDAYSRHPRYGAPPKSLLAAPERILLGLLSDGWIIRNKLIWAKPNPLPNSVRDRLVCAYEVIYFLVRGRDYFFDLDAIRVPHVSSAAPRRTPRAVPTGGGALAAPHSGLAALKVRGRVGHPLGKNPGDVWTIGKSADRSDHPATFPAKLIERPLLATCPERVCDGCRRAWRPRVRVLGRAGGGPRPRRGFVPCGCNMPTRPGVVLDPFFGTGTVGEVARTHGRDWLGIELSPAYVRLARRRLGRMPRSTA